jgi:methylthioribose-1-phosphate isomerase
MLNTIFLDDANSAVMIIDQTLLPGEKRLISLRTTDDFCDAILKLRVRGAPAIGIAAAFGVYLGVKPLTTEDPVAFLKAFDEIATRLDATRPTAVNLKWALARMRRVVTDHRSASIQSIKTLLCREAEAIKKEDERMCQAIGQNTLPLLKDGMGVLTHCNAGSLATGGIGTATAGIYLAHEKGLRFRVYCDETRPLLQGARLTALELSEAGVDTVLICDNMAAALMGQGCIQLVLAGADRIAANGDSANKIGTRSAAICAHYHRIPFYICAPSSTIDPGCPSGDEIPIEERAPEEVTHLWYERPMAPAGVSVRNPAFDVTSAALITGIITENNLVSPPFHFT